MVQRGKALRHQFHTGQFAREREDNKKVKRAADPWREQGMGGWVERKVLKEVCERWKTPKSKKEEEDDETRFLV